MEKDFDQSTWVPRSEKGPAERRPEVSPGLQEVPEKSPNRTPNPDIVKGILPEQIDRLEDELRDQIRGKRTPILPGEPDKDNPPTIH